MKKITLFLLLTCLILPLASAKTSTDNPNNNPKETPKNTNDELWQAVLSNYAKSLEYWPSQGIHTTLSLDANDNVGSTAKIEGDMLYKDQKECYLVPSRVTNKGEVREMPELKDMKASQVKKWQKNVHGHPTGFLKALDKNNQANITIELPVDEGNYKVYLVEQTNEKGKRVKAKFYVDPAKKVIIKVVSFGTATLGDAGSNYTFFMHESGISVLEKIDVLVSIKWGDKKTSIKQIYEYSGFVDKAEARR